MSDVSERRDDVLRIPRKLSDREREELRAKWLDVYGNVYEVLYGSTDVPPPVGVIKNPVFRR